MSNQVYLPALCGSCQYIDLLPAASGAQPSCRRCGGPASVVPGERYSEEDMALFERLSSSLATELVTARLTRKIAAELRDARARNESPETTLLRVTDDLPSLRFLIPALGLERTTYAHRLQMARGIGMVRTIVGARVRVLETA